MAAWHSGWRGECRQGERAGRKQLESRSRSAALALPAHAHYTHIKQSVMATVDGANEEKTERGDTESNKKEKMSLATSKKSPESREGGTVQQNDKTSTAIGTMMLVTAVVKQKNTINPGPLRIAVKCLFSRRNGTPVQ